MNTLFRFLISRIIKIAANSTKLACYLFHFFFPHKRFTLPKHAPAIWPSRHSTHIPLQLWQTNYTAQVSIAVYLNYLFNRLLSPTCEYHFMGTEERDVFIHENFPEAIYKNYQRLQIGAAQADYWRVLVLNKYGGIYMDIDAHLVWPLQWILKPEDDELYIRMKDGRLTNYFIASKPDNPHLEKIILVINQNIIEQNLTGTYEITGPGVFDRVLTNTSIHTTMYRTTCHQGNFTNEFFQYIDKSQGKWTHEQKKIPVIQSVDSNDKSHLS